MRTVEQIKKELVIAASVGRIARGRIVAQGLDGMSVSISGSGNLFWVIASWGGKWDHVSIHITPQPGESARCPTWEEMCLIKELFWHDDETVIQYHPAKSDYVNNHATCLHLWKPQTKAIPKPPKIFVGI